MKDVVCLFLSSVLVLSTSFSSAAQDQKKKADKDWVVELKTVLVELRAVITDRQGHLVQGLKKEDFELREKGRLQDISSFAEELVGPLSISQRVNLANVTPGEPPPPAAINAKLPCSCCGRSPTGVSSSVASKISNRPSFA